MKSEEAYENGVISAFFKDGRLVSIPAQLKKREIVLRKILNDFEQGREYPEKEVNEILMRYNDDFCYLRREMICLGMLCRHNGIYNKCE